MQKLSDQQVYANRTLLVKREQVKRKVAIEIESMPFLKTEGESFEESQSNESAFGAMNDFLPLLLLLF